MKTLTMRKLTASVLAILVTLFVSAVPIGAQSYTISNTTLSGAITNSATTLVLASASASSGSSFGAPAVGQCLVIDAEQMTITAIASTTVTVRRDVSGASSHATSAVVWTAPCNAFQSVDPPALGGNAVCSGQPAPWINQVNGNVFWCNRVTNLWTGTNSLKFTYNSTPVAQ